jgi:hypothetical protein
MIKNDTCNTTNQIVYIKNYKYHIENLKNKLFKKKHF